MQMHDPGKRKADLIPNIYISDSAAKTFLSKIVQSTISIDIDIQESLPLTMFWAILRELI